MQPTNDRRNGWVNLQRFNVKNVKIFYTNKILFQALESKGLQLVTAVMFKLGLKQWKVVLYLGMLPCILEILVHTFFKPKRGEK